MRALALHTRDIWPILAIAVIIGLPVAGYLLQVGRVRRARLAAGRLAAGRAAPGLIRIRVDPDLAETTRSSIAGILGKAAGWTVEFGPPPTGHPRVVVEIAAPGDPPDGLTAAVRTGIARLLPVDPEDIEVRLI